MAFKLRINFSDGTSELVDNDFETEADAEREYGEWVANWSPGRSVLSEAGEGFFGCDIDDCDIWEE